MQFSLQFFPVLAITLGGATLLCNDNNRINSNIGLFFFIIGSITSFFDLLTTPLLTLGFPLLVWISLQPDEQTEIKKDVVTIFKHSVSWFSGFALTWVTKWLLGTIVLGENIFSDAWEQSVYRLEVEDFTRWDAICQNFGMLNFPLIIIALSLILIAIIVSFNKRLEKSGAVCHCGSFAILLVFCSFKPQLSALVVHLQKSDYERGLLPACLGKFCLNANAKTDAKSIALRSYRESAKVSEICGRKHSTCPYSTEPSLAWCRD